MADGEKLLIVEDEPSVRELIRTVVEEEGGYGTFTASNGREALAILEARRCDLIVSDIRMPEVDGLALLSALKKRSDETAKAPVGTVVLTGCNDMALAVQAMQLGALNYVLKPFDSSALVASIASAVKKSREVTKAWQENQDRQHLFELQGMELARMSRELAAMSGSSRGLATRRTPSLPDTEVKQEHTPIPGSRLMDSLAEMDALGVATFEIPVKLGCGGPGTAKLDAKICRVNAGFFVLSSETAFDRGRRLEVFYRERAIASEVVYCNTQRDGTFRIGLAMRDGKYGSFRAEQRIPVNLATTVRIAGRNASVSGTVIDISPSGIGFVTAQPIATGEMVCVDLGAGLAFGEIRHCEKDKGEYRLGLRIEQCLLCDAGELPPRSTFLNAARSLFTGGKKP
jgi:CheY-like chemotaxis protein